MEDAQKIAAASLDQFLVLYQGEGSAREGAIDALLRCFLSAAPIFRHHLAPGAVTHERIGGREVGARHRKVDLWLARGLVLRVQQSFGNQSVLGF